MTGINTISLTTAQFQDALARHIDASKPDPLAKAQLEKLRLIWEQQDGSHDGSQSDGDSLRTILCGTLTLSSEYISISIHVICKFKTKTNGQGGTESNDHPDTATQTSTIIEIPEKCFENEFYIQLTAAANMISLNEHNDMSEQADQLDCKDRAAKRKLRAGMLKRLRSNKSIQRLLVDEEGNDVKSKSTKNKDQKGGYIPLCEALIQQNSKGSNIAHGELEERVNVHENSLEGIRNAIFSHCEDNLDVLEILLNMPYFPRSSKLGGGTEANSNVEHSSQYDQLCSLAERAYLRLLEDAMFDACEKEGEDELLDDLNISNKNHSDDDNYYLASRDAATDGRSRGKGRKMQSKRAKPSC